MRNGTDWRFSAACLGRIGGPQSPASVSASEIPRADELETCRCEVRQVPGRQASDVDARNRRDHPVGRGHRPALLECGAHDVAVGKGRSFGERKDPVGKTVTPRREPLLQACGPPVGTSLPMPKAISAIVTVGRANSASLRTSQAITDGFGVLRSVSEMTLVSRKIRAPVPDRSSGFRE